MDLDRLQQLVEGRLDRRSRLLGAGDQELAAEIISVENESVSIKGL